MLNRPFLVAQISDLHLKAGQRLTYGAMTGAVLSFAGVVVVVSAGSLDALLQHGVNLGDGMMLEAPNPARTVRIVPVRYGELFPYAARPTAN